MIGRKRTVPSKPRSRYVQKVSYSTASSVASGGSGIKEEEGESSLDTPLSAPSFTATERITLVRTVTAGDGSVTRTEYDLEAMGKNIQTLPGLAQTVGDLSTKMKAIRDALSPITASSSVSAIAQALVTLKTNI